MTQTTGIVREGKLIPEELWIRFVEGLEANSKDFEMNRERAKRALAAKIIDAVRKRAAGKFGILLSGGVDSSLIAFIAKKLNCDFTCYTVGLENSEDVIWANKAAKEYGFRHVCRVLSQQEFEFAIRNTAKLVNEADVTKVCVGSVLYAAGKLALNDKINALFGGLGSEEIFAGYQRHSDAFGNGNFEALHKECWNGMKGMWKRDLVRDFTIAKALGLELRAPFLDKELIAYAMSIHPMYKLDKTEKKIILRDAAEFIGLKKEFAWRKKKAAQYGSDFVDGLDKLAAKNGFRYKKDYLARILSAN
ncbi:asparagine synthase C-terminal domain-containing protein [Candidatus Woesearchaeota archaeon]|nr:asparagine synthase C-terminal domain-containing protein [Candidatus Woesearchaeota archaeon]